MTRLCRWIQNCKHCFGPCRRMLVDGLPKGCRLTVIMDCCRLADLKPMSVNADLCSSCTHQSGFRGHSGTGMDLSYKARGCTGLVGACLGVSREELRTEKAKVLHDGSLTIRAVSSRLRDSSNDLSCISRRLTARFGTGL